VLIKNLYEYISLDRTTHEDGTRFYIDPVSKEPLPSVTTILSATADKKFLKEWQDRVGLKKADAIRDEAAALGTLMHTHLECHIQEIERPKGNNLIRQMASRMADVIIEKGLKDVSEVWGFEIPLYYSGLAAGTCDMVGKYRGNGAIFDYKSTRKMKTREQIQDYYTQIAAYSIFHDYLYNTNIETGVIFMVDRALNYKTFVIEGKEFKHHKFQFLTRLEIFLSNKQV
jgi:genome maintenance exonuclease 1